MKEQEAVPGGAPVTASRSSGGPYITLNWGRKPLSWRDGTVVNFVPGVINNFSTTAFTVFHHDSHANSQTCLV